MEILSLSIMVVGLYWLLWIAFLIPPFFMVWFLIRYYLEKKNETSFIEAREPSQFYEAQFTHQGNQYSPDCDAWRNSSLMNIVPKRD